MVPRGLPRKCDGCGAAFTVERGLNFFLRHNNVRNEWAHLCCLSLGKSRITTEPLIFYGDGMRTQPGTSNTLPMTTRSERRPKEMSAIMASGSELVPLSLMSGSLIQMPSNMVTALLQSFLSALLVKSKTSMRKHA
eukprot:CCRYP_001369-RA/>CCRYP_001369-RA protein AED:0.17 eAED:0.14 QI:0/0/0/1/0/0/2/0/135